MSTPGASFPTPTPPKDPLSKEARSRWLLRNTLFAKLQTATFKWWDLNLVGGATKISVCAPVYVMGDHSAGDPGAFYYVPVTARETYELAKYFGAFPLTRSVADQLYNRAEVKVARPPGLDASVGDQGYDFEAASKYYHQQYTSGAHDTNRYAGGHKLWILSAVKTSVNHGFYKSRDSTQGPNRGDLLPQFGAINDLGAFHDEERWDYSQLLQLMKDLRNGGDTPFATTMVQALKDTNRGIWDEGKGNPWCGFAKGMEDRLTKA
jgi:hypothetical protein